MSMRMEWYYSPPSTPKSIYRQPPNLSSSPLPFSSSLVVKHSIIHAILCFLYRLEILKDNMERSISSLTYKGSIPEAIAEARAQKKLFLVYISGDDEYSKDLEQSTWSNLNVADAISKKCIFLHLIDGTPDASNFSAIFPQNFVPSISIVGRNGAMLWNHGGYLNDEELFESVNKAWDALQLQETAAALLTVALASRNPESSISSGPINITSSEIGSPVSPDIPLFSTVNESQGSGDQTLDLRSQLSDDQTLNVDLVRSHMCESEVETNEVKSDPSSCEPMDVDACELQGCSCTSNPSPSVGCMNQQLEIRKLNTVIAEDRDHEPKHDVIEKTGLQVGEDSSNSNARNEVSTDEYPQSSSISEKHKDIISTVATSSSSHFKSSPAEENSSFGMTGALAIEDNGKMGASPNKPEEVTDKADKISQEKLTDVLLNIRLPNGSCFQARFSCTDTLGFVRKHVSENSSSLGSFDLAVPYPRRILSEHDMDKSLSHLGFAHREALIVIPHRLASRINRSHSPSSVSSSITTTDAHDNSVGYFSYLRRVLSYFNPFSYIGGAGNPSYSEPGVNDNLQHYSTEASYNPYSPNRQSPSSSNNTSQANKQQSTSSRSNVRTLRDVEDDDPNSDRNLFWNGNSTQFGGDDKK